MATSISNSERPDDKTGPHHGSDGVDKAPGEETSADLDNSISDTQKAKTPNDADPTRPEPKK